ncbi:uncharacterized protein HKW66_Vig0084410 [Vigna angularis]|uniref:Uncharacterized protein n=1 Tax=Phaseolus angularis TaxID=3914 RepID=A0A8T0KGQ0_PHAAN|nr:uncharacterized protein HKW66_Vig0084410 [Vigna angularis]
MLLSTLYFTIGSERLFVIDIDAETCDKNQERGIHAFELHEITHRPTRVPHS